MNILKKQYFFLYAWYVTEFLIYCLLYLPLRFGTWKKSVLVEFYLISVFAYSEVKVSFALSMWMWTRFQIFVEFAIRASIYMDSKVIRCISATSFAFKRLKFE